MGDTEVGRVVVRVDYDDKAVGSGLVRTKAEISSLGSVKPNFAGMTKGATQAGEQAAAGLVKGFNVQGMSAKFDTELQRMSRSYNQQFMGNAGMMGNVLSAAGPVGIGAGLLLGAGVAADQYATKWQQLNRSVANASGLKLASDQMAALMKQFQATRMLTGISGDVVTAAAAGLGARVGANQLGAASQSTAIWASKWKADSGSIAKDFANLGSSMMTQGQSWTGFIDANGDAIDALAKKYNADAGSILGALNKLMPTLSRLGVTQGAMPGMEALLASAQSWGIAPERVASMLNQGISTMQGKASVDLSKLLNVDTSTFQKMLQTDTVGTFQKITVAMQGMNDQGASLKSKFGKGGFDLISLLGDPAKAKELADNIELANKAYGSGGSALDAYGAKLSTAEGQMARLGEIWKVTMETIGAPLIGGAASGLNMINSALITMGTEAGLAVKALQTVYAAAAYVPSKGSQSPLSQFGNFVSWAKAGGYSQPSITDTGFDLFDSQGQAAAKAGETSSASYITALNNKLPSGITKAVSNAYLVAGGLVLQTAAQAGKVAGDAWVAAYGQAASQGMTYQADYINTKTGKAMKGAGWLSSQNSSDWSLGTAQGSTQVLSSTPNRTMSALAMSSGAKGSWWDIFANGAKIAESKVGESFESIDKKYSDMVISWPKVIRNEKDQIGKAISDVFSDSILTLEEKGDLQKTLDMLTDQLKSKDIPLEFNPDIKKLIDQTNAAIKGIDTTLTFKPIYEDFSSEAYRQKWRYENQDFVKNLTPAQSDNWMKMLQYEQEIIDNSDKYDPQIVKEAQDAKLAQEMAVTAFKDGNVTATGIWGTAQSILNQYPLLASAIRTMGTDISRAILENIASGNAKGQFYPYDYKGQSAYSNYGNSGINPFLPSASVYSIPSSYSGGTAKSGTPKWTLTDLMNAAVKGSYALGGKATERGLYQLAEKEPEYVIPQSQVPGLIDAFQQAPMGSMQYLTREKFMEESARYTITKPKSYMWSKYPAAPPINYSNMQNMPTAWLSDPQMTGNEFISPQLRQMQLDAIGGAGSVKPYFARGNQAQPSWWSSAANAISPNAAWDAQKGGTVPRIADIKSMMPSTISNVDAWNAIYDDSDTCVAYAPRDPALKFTPNLQPQKALNQKAWNAIYDDSGTCIAYAPPDKSLKFTPAGASPSQNAYPIGSIASYLKDNTVQLGKVNDSLKQTATVMGSSFQKGGSLDKYMTGVGSISGVAGMSGPMVWPDQNGQVLRYDPRNDTCDQLGMLAAPYLTTSDPFYLGLTTGAERNNFTTSYEEGGMGGIASNPANQALANAMASQGSMKAGEGFMFLPSTGGQGVPVTLQGNSQGQLRAMAMSTDATAKNTKAIQLSQGVLINTMGQVVGGVNAMGAIMSYGGGGGNTFGTGPKYGSFFNNWISGGWSQVGAFANEPSWGGVAASNKASGGSGGGSSGWGHVPGGGSSGGSGGDYGSWSPSFAEGDIVSKPTIGLFGEAGTEAIVPISNRAAGMRILPRVLRGLGIGSYAAGGVFGRGMSAPAGGFQDNSTIIIQGSNLSEAALKRAIVAAKKEIYAGMDLRLYRAGRR